MMRQGDLFQPAPTVNQLRDDAIARVTARAEAARPGFVDEACAWVLDYLADCGPTSGEHLTAYCKARGIRPPDDRAFGAVYLRLVKQGRIEPCGTVRRERGHGTAGGRIWRLTVSRLEE